MSQTSPTALKMGLREWSLLLLLSLLWGGSFFFAEIVLAEIPPLSLAAWRVSLAAALLWLIAILFGHCRPWSLRTCGALFFMGVLNNAIPFSLIFWGQTSIASALAAILNATTPLFTILLAQVLTDDERLNPFKCLGVLLGFLGVVVMLGPTVNDAAGNNIWPPIAVLGAALSYALAGIFARRFKDLTPGEAARGQLTGSSLIMIPLAYYLDGPSGLAQLPGEALLALLALAFLSTALAYLIYFRILKSAGASNLLLVTFLIPASAIFLGLWFLDENLTKPQIIGMSLIALGLMCMHGALPALLRQRSKIGVNSL